MLIIIVLGALQRRRHMQLIIGSEEGQRQIVIYVSIHPRQGKLYSVDTGFVPRFKQSLPRARDIRILLQRICNRRKVEVCKYYGEARQPCCVFPSVWRRLEVDLLRYHQIKFVEPFQTVATRQQSIDTLHYGENIADRRRGAGTHDLKKSRIGWIEVQHSAVLKEEILTLAWRPTTFSRLRHR